jgi:RNA polymerase sigma-70 factor (ECF subfamily)
VERISFEKLVQDWAPRATALARAIAGDADAEDIAQNSFIRAWQSLSTLADPAKFDAWLMAIVRNLARNRVRDRALERRPPPPPSPNRTPDLDHVRAAVDALPEEQREIVRLRYEVDLSYAEIASALAIDEALVKSRLHEAKTTLAEKIPRS